MITTRLVTLLKYYVFWLLFFALSRLIFVVYNIQSIGDTPFGQILLSFIKGLKLDLSMAGYITFIAGLIFASAFFVSDKLLKKIIKIYTFPIIVILSIISISDAELYRNWGFRMDSTILLYLKTPKDAMASTKLWLTVVLIILMLSLIVLSYRVLKKYVLSNLHAKTTDKWWSIPIYILFCGFVFIAIRGGVGIAPINTGAVYFSQHTFANHSAVNVHWHLGNSLMYADKSRKVQVIDDETANEKFAELFDVEWNHSKFTSVKKPNIIVLILESFSSRIVEPLGGRKGVTPNINKLVNEGVLYTNCFANGDRSDKGIVSILSAYPAQPKTSIIKNSTKTEKLPYLTHELNNMGYNTAFYYGGDINFANMRSYLVSSKFDAITSLNDFDSKHKNSKWGIHDHIVFQKVFDDCNTETGPFFKAFFTLSSHEPFDVPLEGPFNDDSEENKYLNSAYYTDNSLGEFISKSKQQSWWDSTLVIMVPDHGARWPDNVNYASREKFEIPLLIVGGALSVRDTLIDEYVNQTDIAKIIGAQLDQEFEEFTFSKNRIDSLQSFAFYAFNNGFGYFNKSGGAVYDITSGTPLYNESENSSKLLIEGKSYMQSLLNDYSTK